MDKRNRKSQGCTDIAPILSRKTAHSLHPYVSDNHPVAFAVRYINSTRTQKSWWFPRPRWDDSLRVFPDDQSIGITRELQRVRVESPYCRTCGAYLCNQRIFAYQGHLNVVCENCYGGLKGRRNHSHYHLQLLSQMIMIFVYSIQAIQFVQGSGVLVLALKKNPNNDRQI